MGRRTEVGRSAVLRMLFSLDRLGSVGRREAF